MKEPFITVKELVKKGVIPLGKTKLYELIQSGRLPSYRFGGKILLLESEVWQAIKTKGHLKVLHSERGKVHG